jgi:hypothetical protein
VGVAPAEEFARKSSAAVGLWSIAAVIGVVIVLLVIIAIKNTRDTTVNGQGSVQEYSSSTASQRPAFLLDAKQTHVLALSHLALGGRADCRPFKDRTRVVAREFDGGGLWLTSLTTENSVGHKRVTHIFLDTEGLSPDEISWIRGGLTTFTKIYSKVELEGYSCGSGDYLDALRPLARSSSKPRTVVPDPSSTSSGATAVAPGAPFGE